VKNFECAALRTFVFSPSSFFYKKKKKNMRKILKNLPEFFSFPLKAFFSLGKKVFENYKCAAECVADFSVFFSSSFCVCGCVCVCVCVCVCLKGFTLLWVFFWYKIDFVQWDGGTVPQHFQNDFFSKFCK
jgi:ABC-type glycerol-3-phosphate transport system permease component